MNKRKSLKEIAQDARTTEKVSKPVKVNPVPETITRNMPLGEVAEVLTKAVARFNDARVNDYSKFHTDIATIIDPLLAEFGLSYAAWEIKKTDTADRYFALKVDRTLDKNQGTSSRGRINRLWFELSEVLLGDEPWKAQPELDSLETVFELWAVADSTTSVDSFVQWRDKLRAELEEVEQKLAAARSRRAIAKGELQAARRLAFQGSTQEAKPEITLEPGTVWPIYQKPLTQEEFEGDARLVRKLDTMHDGERWLVEFESGDRVERLIAFAEVAA